MAHNMIAIFEDHHPDELGFLPEMIDQDDPRPAVEQFDANYQYGGWQPIEKFTAKGFVLKYPGDPPYEPIAMWPLRDEMIVVYHYGFVAVFQRDGSFECARLE